MDPVEASEQLIDLVFEYLVSLESCPKCVELDSPIRRIAHWRSVGEGVVGLLEQSDRSPNVSQFALHIAVPAHFPTPGYGSILVFCTASAFDFTRKPPHGPISSGVVVRARRQDLDHSVEACAVVMRAVVLRRRMGQMSAQYSNPR
ncbi:hypothetical protein [Burkholderia sp. YIM B11467]